ncbi:thioredoxin-related protein, putative [Plasmodium ovale wallikeri]|uniref:Thioredoxin-related protein, putative n=2 Tax=Plasmodium ovale TaxID=36330 RepID=A0A1A8Z725_PLAOA|nr:thioredoxin-related protein, putative [Plasmodium ovale wallikeri]SBT40126.1 thioredoxin-related protein, putative [Plasmodium ovale wallikeri]SBT77909.1 thioredoxin-related protein, putative [Plasmodium ovale]
MAKITKSLILILFSTLLTLCYSQVVELTDKNFESLTKISSGGENPESWFIKFYAPWCSHCKAMIKTWVDLANELSGKVNVGKIDVTTNAKTRKRFNIEGFPTLLYFKDGKMYDYQHYDRSLDAFKNFVFETYKNYKSSDPPRPLNFFDIFKDMANETFINIDRIYTHAFPALTLIIVLSFMVGFLSCFVVNKFFFFPGKESVVTEEVEEEEEECEKED